MVEKTNGEIKYVTFKWLFATTITSIGIVLSVMYFMMSKIDAKVDKVDYLRDQAVIEKKVDSSVYVVKVQALCDTIDGIKDTVEKNEKKMDDVKIQLTDVIKWQQRVLQKLDIK